MRIRARISAVMSACSIVFLSMTGALAGPATLDTSFGGDGKVVTDITRTFDTAYALAIQADGKIVAAGSAGGGGGRFGLARYNADGTLDVSFGDDGIVKTDFAISTDVALGLATQADGKIVAAGGASGEGEGMFALARYNDDGTLDASFGDGGKVTTNFTTGIDRASDVAIQPGGKIVAVGTASVFCECSTFALARYNDDGTLDTSFGVDGKVTTSFSSGAEANGMALQPDGKIVAVGGKPPSGRFKIARYDVDGALDSTFSDDGKATAHTGHGTTVGSASANAAAVQTNGKIVVAGYGDAPEFPDDPGETFPKFFVYRFQENGILDGTFGEARTGFAGIGMTAEDVVIQGDGKIVAAGHTGNGKFVLVRYRRFGKEDSAFGGDGIVKTNFGPLVDGAYAVALQADGKIVAAGHAGAEDGGFALARYLGGS